MLQNQPMVHDAAAHGFDREVSTYQRARPSYHPDLVARFVERYGTGAVLEIGATAGAGVRAAATPWATVISSSAGCSQRWSGCT